MWMAVLKKATSGYRIGSMWCVYRTKSEPVLVTARVLDVVSPGAPFVDTNYAPLYFTIEDAQKHFTKPTQDFNSLMEESIMQCEGAYC